MCLDIGHDFYCAYQNAFVAKSEFNSAGSFYHQPKNGVPYVARGVDECECLTCPAIDKTKCGECRQPALLKMERAEVLSKNVDRFGNLVGPGVWLLSRCSHCMAQYKMRGVLR